MVCDTVDENVLHDSNLNIIPTVTFYIIVAIRTLNCKANIPTANTNLHFFDRVSILIFNKNCLRSLKGLEKIFCTQKAFCVKAHRSPKIRWELQIRILQTFKNTGM